MMIEDYDNTKKDTAFILFIIAVVSFAIFLSCKPTKIITVTDTIKQIEYKTKLEKEIVRYDSVVTVTDTFDNIVFRDRTVFQTKTHTKIDTIFSDKEVIKANPVNEQLKAENEKLLQKSTFKGRVIAILSFMIIVILLLWRIVK